VSLDPAEFLYEPPKIFQTQVNPLPVLHPLILSLNFDCFPCFKFHPIDHFLINQKPNLLFVVDFCLPQQHLPPNVHRLGTQYSLKHLLKQSWKISFHVLVFLESDVTVDLVKF
jgi:hypothetical protein